MELGNTVCIKRYLDESFEQYLWKGYVVDTYKTFDGEDVIRIQHANSKWLSDFWNDNIYFSRIVLLEFKKKY